MKKTSPISYTRPGHPLKKSLDSPKSPDFVPAFMEQQLSPPASKATNKQQDALFSPDFVTSEQQSRGKAEPDKWEEEKGAGNRATEQKKYEPPQRRWAKERQRATSGSSAGAEPEHSHDMDYSEYLAREVIKGPNPANMTWEEEERSYDKAAQEWKESMRIDDPMLFKPQSPQSAGSPGGMSWGRSNKSAVSVGGGGGGRGNSPPPPRFRQQFSREYSREEVEPMEESGSPRGYYGGGGGRGGGRHGETGGYRDSTAPRDYRGGYDSGRSSSYRGRGDYQDNWRDSGSSRERKISTDSAGRRGGDRQMSRTDSYDSPPPARGGGGERHYSEGDRDYTQRQRQVSEGGGGRGGSVSSDAPPTVADSRASGDSKDVLTQQQKQENNKPEEHAPRE